MTNQKLNLIGTSTNRVADENFRRLGDQADDLASRLAAIEALIVGGVLLDSAIPDTIARRDEVTLLSMLDQGQYFRVTTTIGTGVATGLGVAFSDLSAFLVMQNLDPALALVPHYVRLVCTGAGTNLTAAQIAVAIDLGTRYSSGGTDLSARAFNANTGFTTAPLAKVYAGALVTTATTGNTREIGRADLKKAAAPAWNVGDEVLITFGDPAAGGAAGSLSTASATCIQRSFGPCELHSSGHSLLIHLWQPAVAVAPTFEVEAGFWMR